MVRLEPGPQGVQDQERIFARRLFDLDQAEAPRQGRVVTNGLLELLERGGADARQLTPRQRQLELRGDLFGRFTQEQLMNLVEEQHHATARRQNLFADLRDATR